jgi:hypothetical protein
VSQVGHLPELYEDARSAKYNIHLSYNDRPSFTNTVKLLLITVGTHNTSSFAVWEVRNKLHNKVKGN